jgi:hypothetical protein
VRRFEFGNPEAILLSREARSCKGCEYHVILWGLEYCANGKSKPGITNMRRCKHYKETKGD